MSYDAPLAGLKVVDLSQGIAGPYCAMLLAQHGAEVIKVESIGEGDWARALGVRYESHTAFSIIGNMGKRSISLDLKTEAGKQVLWRLLEGADIFLEGFRPGVIKRLGFDYEAVSAREPRILYVSISGFGQTGPRAEQPAYAPVVHAASGFDHVQFTYQDGQERPAKTGIFVADVLAAVYAFGAVQTALVGRLRHGNGQFIDVALMDSMINLLVFECQEAQFPSKDRRPLYVPMRARDGFVIVAPVNQRNFEQLADATGHPEWRTDPRFATVAARTTHWDALMNAVEGWTSARPARECEDRLMKAGVPCSRYLTMAEAMSDPQLAARGSLATVTDGAGDFRVPNPPFKFADGSVGVEPSVPALDADTKEVLTRLK